DLVDPSGPSRREAGEGRVRQIRLHAYEIRVVEGVERFEPELQARTPREIEVLEQREIKVVDGGPAQHVARGVAELAEGRLGEGGGIEPLLDRSWARRIAGDVRPIRAEAVEDVPEIGGPDRDREPVLPGVDAVHLPTADDRVLHAGSRAGVALAL